MDNRIAYKVKKTNCKTSTKNLLKEMFREEKDQAKYDNGVRDLHPEMTQHNVWLEKPNIETFDKERDERIKEINKKRAERTGEEYTAYERRKLRSDTVDMLSQVVQPSSEWINNHTREEAVALLTEAYNMMKEHPELYGEVKAAVIHLDESSPHLQVLSSALDMENLRSKAKELVGNKTAMSEKQTIFANGLKERGFDVERGVNRLSHNYKARKEYLENKYQTPITRHNEQKYERLEQIEQQFKDNIIERAKHLGMVDLDGTYYYKDEEGNQQHMNVRDMIVADLLTLGDKTDEREQRMQQADLDFIEEEHDEKIQAKTRQLEQLQQDNEKLKKEKETNKNIIANQNKKQFEIINDTEKMKQEHNTVKKDLQSLIQERNEYKQGNSTLEQKNAQLRAENDKLTKRNMFLDELGTKDKGEYVKKQDNAVMSYLRHGVYKDKPQEFSNLIKKSYKFIDNHAQRRYSHFNARPTPKQNTHDKTRDLEL